MRSQHRGLRTFCAAAEQLSFKKAADKLCVTPSAVSHQISELEEDLNTKLFTRLTRSISLTEDGSFLYAAVSPCLHTIDEAVEKVRRSAIRSPLLVQMPEFFASELLMPNIGRFTKLHPEIDLHIEGLGIRDALSPAADINIVLSRKTPRAIKVAKLFPIRYVPACSKQQRALWESRGTRGLDAIQKATLLLHKARPRAWAQWSEKAGVADLEPNKIIHVDSMFALARAAEQGVGIALIPLPVSQEWFDSGALVPLHDSHLVTEDYYWLVLNDNSANSRSRRPALTFWHWMEESFSRYQ